MGRREQPRVEGLAGSRGQEVTEVKHCEVATGDFWGEGGL